MYLRIFRIFLLNIDNIPINRFKRLITILNLLRIPYKLIRL